MIVARWSKVLLLASVGFYFVLVVLNNTTDFGSNYQYVQHVLAMDSTFPGNHGMWRAINRPAIYLVFYLGIIAYELLNAVLCCWGAFALFRARKAPESDFQQAKCIGVAALTAGMLLWFVAFVCVGGEWFLMWQSKVWNGEETAFRMFVIEALILLLLQMREPG
jgi:predicted small integral membrane protein